MEIHGFAIDVINELVRIEQNLRFINDDVKGVANLKSRSDSLRAIFESRGYEIPELLGKEYIQTANMEVSFERDENLPKGANIIRRVIRPEISLNGEMIQAAMVVVAFNE